MTYMCWLIVTITYWVVTGVLLLVTTFGFCLVIWQLQGRVDVIHNAPLMGLNILGLAGTFFALWVTCDLQRQRPPL